MKPLSRLFLNIFPKFLVRVYGSGGMKKIKKIISIGSLSSLLLMPLVAASCKKNGNDKKFQIINNESNPQTSNQMTPTRWPPNSINDNDDKSDKNEKTDNNQNSESPVNPNETDDEEEKKLKEKQEQEDEKSKVTKFPM
ncbi:variable surface lipoprotein [Mycoplasma mycoides]|uniref:variable surface lipoprotein n=1 Tax=Mycoplasma mycoides TaxID=2102 RepID=UPI001FD4C7EB|nr:variable surface lipoprotein [Mycoplasma mycoides]